MSSKKSSSKAAVGAVKFEAKPKARRPGRHKKNKKPANQTFFTNGVCR